MHHQAISMSEKQSRSLRWAIFFLFWSGWCVCHTAKAQQDWLPLEKSVSGLPPEEAADKIHAQMYQVRSQSLDLGKQWAALGIQKATSSKDAIRLATAQLDAGVVDYLSGAYDAAFQHYTSSLSIFEKNKDEAGQGRVLNELGTWYKRRKDMDQSLTHFSRALLLSTRAKDSVTMSTALDNSGLVYLTQGKINEADSCFQRCLQVRQNIRDSVGLGYVWSNLAEVALARKQTELSASYLQQSASIRRAIKDGFGEAISINNIGELYLQSGQPQKAIPWFQSSISKAALVGVPDLQQHSLHLLADAFAATGQYQLAFRALQQGKTIKDSLFNVARDKTIAEMEARFGKERDQQMIERQALELQVAQNRQRLLVILGIALLLAVAGWMVYYRQQQARRQQAALYAQQTAYQKALLEGTIAAQEDERSRISRELHDGIGQELSAIRMGMQQTLQKVPDPALLNRLADQVERAAHNVRSISHTMMPKALTELGLEAALQDLAQAISSQTPLQVTFNKIGTSVRLSPQQELALYRVAQELLNNTLKHAKASEADLQLIFRKDHVVLLVEDDGVGLTHPDKKGHGFHNIQSRLQALNADIHYESREDAGLVVTIKMPVNATSENIAVLS